MSDPLTPPETPPAPSTPSAPAAAPERLPDDHPLVTALAAQKQKNAELQQQIEAAKKGTAPKPAPKPESKAGGDDVASALAELRQQLADEKAAREAAEVTALRVKLGASLPPEFIELLTGTTEDEIKAQVDKLTPHLKSSSGPLPNPQQGTPPGKTGGSVAAGRDRYKAAHPNS